MSVRYAHLLVVDDDERRREEVCAPLRERQLYTLSIASEVAQVWHTLATESVDLVLVDAALAAANDCALLRQVREEEQLSGIQVMVLAPAGETGLVASCLEAGANDFLFWPVNPVLLKARCDQVVRQRYLQEQLASSVQAFEEMLALANDLQQEILPLGVALSAEKDFNHLLTRIVEKAQAICHAEGGLLYLRTAGEELQLALAHHRSLHITWRPNSQAALSWLPVPLYRPEDGQPNEQNALAAVALSGESLNVADIYQKTPFDFRGLKFLDQAYGYRSVSSLIVPLRNEKVHGVLQLVNAQDPATGRIVPFTRYHQLVAESLASQAALVLHNRALREQQEALHELQRELQIGREIQAGFFPEQLPQPARWEVAAHLHPAREVCGDFYDVFQLANGRLGLVVADVCGKGVGAALFMALIRSLLRAFIQQSYHVRGWRPGTASDIRALVDAVHLTNSYISQNHQHDHMFATLFMGILDPDSGRLLYVNAGHEPPLVFAPGRAWSRLGRSGPAVGLLEEAVFTVDEAFVEPGQSLLVFTDGVTEARNASGQPFSFERLLALLESPGPAEDTTAGLLPATALLQQIDEEVRAYTAQVEPFDDLTLLAVYHREPRGFGNRPAKS